MVYERTCPSFAFVFLVTLQVSDISNHLVFSRNIRRILVLTYQYELDFNIKSFGIKSTFISVTIRNGVRILLLKCFINCRKSELYLTISFNSTETYLQYCNRVNCGFHVFSILNDELMIYVYLRQTVLEPIETNFLAVYI